MTEREEPPRKELLDHTGTPELALVSATEQGGVVIVSIVGEVDISNIDGIAGVIYALPNTEDGLVIDVTKVSYLDSSAVSLLHDVAMRLRSRAQRLIVASPPGTPPRRILELTALYVNAPIADSLPDALKQLGDTSLP